LEERGAEDEFDEAVSIAISRLFADFFGSYSRAINKAMKRSGKLFSLPFKRVLVADEVYFEWLMCYIHRNPLHHGFCGTFEEWEHSSYREILRGLGGECAINAISTLSANSTPDIGEATSAVSTQSANSTKDIGEATSAVSTQSANSTKDIGEATSAVSTQSANSTANKPEETICDIPFLKYWFANTNDFFQAHRQSELALLNQKLLLE
jgi:hypothetical protein